MFRTTVGVRRNADNIFKLVTGDEDLVKNRPRLLQAVKQHVEGCPTCMKKYLALKLTFELEECASETHHP